MAASRDEYLLFFLFVLGLVAASAGLIVGLDALVGEGAPTNQTIEENASARLESVDGLTATREVVITRGNETSRTIERVALRPGTGDIRASRLSGAGLADVRVSNDSTLWLYDRDTQTVKRLSVERTTGRLDRVVRLVSQLNLSNESSAEPSTDDVGVSPLPVVPAGGQSQQTVGPAQTQSSYTVTTAGTKTVDGRSAVMVELAQTSSVSEPVANFTQTLWLDSEWYYPLKQRTAWTQGGQRRTLTTTYRNVTFNPEFASGTFVFDPPSNATVETPDTPDQQQYDSVSALRADAALSVPAPTVPDGFALASATRTTGRIDSIGLRYVNSSSVLTVAKLAPSIEPRTDGETLTVAGRRATYRNLGPRQVITWTCNGVQYKIGGRNLSQEQLVDIAHSVGCE
ncbi:outer membrane lipoprotein carrier protein LolA [Salinibaculum salinum]|uniref:LolA family protein n=1 Tax=Salinibaculum salinum TaxID=3131996 RepID=UPI0030EB2A5B